MATNWSEEELANFTEQDNAQLSQQQVNNIDSSDRETHCTLVQLKFGSKKLDNGEKNVMQLCNVETTTKCSFRYLNFDKIITCVGHSQDDRQISKLTSSASVAATQRGMLKIHSEPIITEKLV